MAGPTAVGKTALSIELAQHFGTEIISADSRQIFREMKIGTAVPEQSELDSVPHHFIQQLSIYDDFSAGDFEIDAIARLEKLFEKHKTVVLTGGSGLYVKAVTHGLDEHPSAPEIRKQLNTDFDQKGIAFLQDKLKRLDPVTYNRIDLNNHQRMIRALEVCIVSGRPYSEFLTAEEKERNFHTVAVGLELPRRILNERINQRVDNMVANGLVEEAQNLYSKRHLNALQTVGYKELFAAFGGECTTKEAIESIKTNTRKFAKRQMTWFKKNLDAKWFDPGEKEAIIQWITNEIYRNSED